MPPFTIGKVFSDEAVNSLQRERQMQQDNAARAYQLELQRRQQQNQGEIASRELDLRARAIDNDTSPEERRLRLELTREGLAGKKEDRLLKREVTGTELEMARSRLAGDSEERVLRKRLGEGELDARNRAITETETQGAFDREFKPAELALKKMEITRRTAADDARIEQKKAELVEKRRQVDELVTAGEHYRKTLKPEEWKLKERELNQMIAMHQDRMGVLQKELGLSERRVADAEANTKIRLGESVDKSSLAWAAHDLDQQKVTAEMANLEARTNLTQEQARDLLVAGKLDSFKAMTGRLNALVNRYKVASDVNNAAFNEQEAASAQAEVASFLHVLKTAAPGMYADVMQAGGAQAAGAASDGLYGDEGYGAAGRFVDNFIERFGKPPATPKGK